MLTALTLAISMSAAPLLQDAVQEPTPQQAYDAWWESMTARPLPALSTGFVFEGAVAAEDSEARIFTMRVEGTLHYRDATHVRMDGTIAAAGDDGTRASGRFTLYVDAERMYLSGSFRALDADGDEEEAVEGAASLSTAKLRGAAKAAQETYEALGMGALGVSGALLDRPVGEWLHPVLAARSTVEQLRVDRFALDDEVAACTLAVDVDAFREAMTGMLATTGIDGDPELMREFDAEMAPMLEWLAGLSFDLSMDAATGLPRPFSISLSLPELMLDEGAPPATVTVSARLVGTELEPKFAEDLFAVPGDVAWFDLDPFLDMALGAMRAMAMEMEAELDAEF